MSPLSGDLRLPKNSKVISSDVIFISLVFDLLKTTASLNASNLFDLSGSVCSNPNSVTLYSLPCRGVRLIHCWVIVTTSSVSPADKARLKSLSSNFSSIFFCERNTFEIL